MGTTQASAASVVACLAMLCAPAASVAADPSDSPAEATRTTSELLVRGAGYGQPQGESRVRALQRRLRALGHKPGPVDGRYGPLTEAAVERLQRDSGLSVDGIVGPRTRRVLNAESPPLVPGAGYWKPAGSRQVREIQRRLRAHGHRPGPIDGLYGPRTQAAVERFQRSAGQPASGVLSRVTATALARVDGAQADRDASTADRGTESRRQGRSSGSGVQDAKADGRPLQADAVAPAAGSDQSSTRSPAAVDDRSTETDGGVSDRVLLLLALAVAGGGLIAAWLVRRRRRPEAGEVSAQPLRPRPRPTGKVAEATNGAAEPAPDGTRTLAPNAPVIEATPGASRAEPTEATDAAPTEASAAPSDARKVASDRGGNAAKHGAGNRPKTKHGARKGAKAKNGAGKAARSPVAKEAETSAAKPKHGDAKLAPTGGGNQPLHGAARRTQHGARKAAPNGAGKGAPNGAGNGAPTSARTAAPKGARKQAPTAAAKEAVNAARKARKETATRVPEGATKERGNAPSKSPAGARRPVPSGAKQAQSGSAQPAPTSAGKAQRPVPEPAPSRGNEPAPNGAREVAPRAPVAQARPSTKPTPLPSAPAALGYISVREPSAADDHELQDQTVAISTACRDRGLVLKEVIRDREQVDDAGPARPGMTYALERLAAGDASCLVVAELGRLSRSTPRLGYILEWLRLRDARLVAVDEGLDTGTKSGSEAAETLVSRYLSERRQQDSPRLAQPGRVPDPVAIATTSARSPRPDASEVKLRIREMRADGMTLQAIADRLNEENVPTLRGGARWRPSAVQAAAGYRRPAPTAPAEPDGSGPPTGRRRRRRPNSSRKGGGAR